MPRNDPIPLPSMGYINEAIKYDSETGELIWKERPLHHFKNMHGKNTFNSKFANKPCASKHLSGYLCLLLNGKKYLAHRVIWKLIAGEDPGKNIDHMDACKSNNRWSNLRLANKSENARNVGIGNRNSTGYKGVSFDSRRNKFFASICHYGKTMGLGRFATAELAHEAYKNASCELHGEFGRAK